MKPVKLLLAFFFFCPLLPIAAQHEEAPHHIGVEHPHWRISPFIGHTFVALEEGGEHTPIASWALDIEYWWKEHWGIGLHNDLEIESFIIETENGEFIERDYPIVVTLDLLLKPWKNFVFYAGPGVELDSNEDFSLFRLGIEYEFVVNEHIDIAPTLFHDNRVDAFNTWTVALGVGWRF